MSRTASRGSVLRRTSEEMPWEWTVRLSFRTLARVGLCGGHHSCSHRNMAEPCLRDDPDVTGPYCPETYNCLSIGGGAVTVREDLVERCPGSAVMAESNFVRSDVLLSVSPFLGDHTGHLTQLTQIHLEVLPELIISGRPTLRAVQRRPSVANTRRLVEQHCRIGPRQLRWVHNVSPLLLAIHILHSCSALQLRRRGLARLLHARMSLSSRAAHRTRGRRNPSEYHELNQKRRHRLGD